MFPLIKSSTIVAPAFGPRTKLLGQILAASLAYYGGLRIETFALGTIVFHFGVLNYFITVFWFLLIINAMNLIDGLAAGVAFFACLVMASMAIMKSDYTIALEFAAIAGALLGFLRYNFNPASIFMGDGGSYFIGYGIAALSILGSIKSQLGATLLIPLLALGVPIFDTILSPVRRWGLGHKMFQADKGHIHHHLIARGLSSRRTVLIIYGISFVLCIYAIILVNLRNNLAGLTLIVLIILFFIVVRKLGYLEYLAIDKIYGWFNDVPDEAGLTHDRRSFLSIQIEIEKAQDTEDLWQYICQALEMMRFDRGELHIYYSMDEALSKPASVAAGTYDGMEMRQEQVKGCDSRSMIWKANEEKNRGIVRLWACGHHRRWKDRKNTGLFRVEIPLGVGNSDKKLVLIKDLTLEPIKPYTLRRVEYLRRSIMTAKEKIKR